MPLTSGTRLGPYEILAPIGAGGMGEVYKARDTRLDRLVALKVLPAALAADPEFRERFDREARTISQLTHPNICTLFDVGEAALPATSHQPPATSGETIQFLVMELLDGQTLAARIAKGAMPLDEALPVAIQIGEALTAAHRAGLVHRDLKPGNVMLTKTGGGAASAPQAKLLDFGLAKAAGVAQSGPAGVSMMPTTPAAMTAQGAIVGTFQYMAPEQVEGHDADARSDIFAFGCVLHEMLTGKKAFEGKTHASLIGAIMHAEPQAISGIVPSTSPALDRVARKCLAKDQEARWQSAIDLVDELKWIAGQSGQPVEPAAPRARPSRATLPWSLAIVSTIVAAALGVWLAMTRRPPERPQAQARFTVTLPDGWAALTGAPVLGVAAVSPGGKYFVIPGTVKGGASGLWLRPIDAVDARLIPHTENAGSPFWSPDGQTIGFFDTSTHQLKRTTLTGDATSVICEAVNPQGADWNRDGVILFASNAGVQKVDASGGAPVLLVKRTQGQPGIYLPQFLKDGRRFIYAVFGSGMFVSSLDGGEPRPVLNKPNAPVSLVNDDDDHVLFLRGTTLVLQRLDTKSMAMTGPVTPVLEGVALFSVSPQVLAYAPPREANSDDLVWFDRRGQRTAAIGDRADYSNVELSPDGSRLLTAMLNPALRSRDIWLYDVARGVRQRFTFSEAIARTAVWSPDGARVLFNIRGKAGALDFFQKPADGSGAEQPVLVDGLSKDALGWSPDGRYLLYRVTGGSTGNDLMAMPVFGDRKPLPISATPFDEQDGRLSPDGAWVAYSTDESGQLEVYVARFPSGGGKARISSTGGNHPRWRRDGKELFYVSLDGKIMSVDIAMTPEAARPGEAHALFAVHVPPQAGYNYDVAPDGQRFLVITDMSAERMPVIVTNWRSAK